MDKKYSIEQLGWCKAENGEYIYCAGDMIISKEGKSQNDANLPITQKFHLEIDNDLMESDASKASLCHIYIDKKYSMIIFATALLGIMRQIVLDADIKPPCVVYMYGESQTRKTSLARLFCQLYNRSKLKSGDTVGINRVNSSDYKTEELMAEYKDATYILDDLYKEPNKKRRSENEQCVRNIIRNFADNSPRQTAKSSHQNNCQVLVTTEYLLECKTDLGRCFIVQIEHQIDGGKMAACQDTPLHLSTAYFYFIKWLCSHYEDIVIRLKTEFKDIRKDICDENTKYARIHEEAFLLKFVFGVFCEYSEEIKGIEHKSLKKAKSKLKKYLNRVIASQNSILEYLNIQECTHYNFSQELIKMLNEHFIVSGKKGSECFEKKKYIYITCECFCKGLYKKYKNTFTSKRVAKYFAEHFISKRDGEKNVVKYGKCGRRYLALDIDRLYEDADDVTAKIENMFM